MININENKIVRFIVDYNLDKLKVVEPPKEPDITVGNLTIEQLTNIISNIFDKKFDEKFDQKFDEKIKPIIDEISLIKQKMVTKWCNRNYWAKIKTYWKWYKRNERRY